MHQFDDDPLVDHHALADIAVGAVALVGDKAQVGGAVALQGGDAAGAVFGAQRRGKASAPTIAFRIEPMSLPASAARSSRIFRNDGGADIGDRLQIGDRLSCCSSGRRRPGSPDSRAPAPRSPPSPRPGSDDTKRCCARDRPGGCPRHGAPAPCGRNRAALPPARKSARARRKPAPPRPTARAKSAKGRGPALQLDQVGFPGQRQAGEARRSAISSGRTAPSRSW